MNEYDQTEKMFVGIPLTFCTDLILLYVPLDIRRSYFPRHHVGLPDRQLRLQDRVFFMSKYTFNLMFL